MSSSFTHPLGQIAVFVFRDRFLLASLASAMFVVLVVALHFPGSLPMRVNNFWVHGVIEWAKISGGLPPTDGASLL
jgi:hypothetical protein